jgi:mannose-6-phosphate isomerase
MTTAKPIRFRPIFMERVWGGRELHTRLGKALPAGAPIGEAWEIVDRPEACSLVEGGPWAGFTLHDLWTNHRIEIFGAAYAHHPSERFPILVKLLDARETLSVQVHPPLEKADELGGEPKTEMWYFLEADPDACIYAGVAPGVSAEQFQAELEAGTVESVLPRLPVRTGESIFIPSGRLHAIGGGNLIAEIQQNSDTTYRVFDWNRAGLDGRPRELHLDASMASIDFSDTAPTLQLASSPLLADCPFFRVEKRPAPSSAPAALDRGFVLWGVAQGQVSFGEEVFSRGDFLLLPAGMDWQGFSAVPATELLEITLPPAS